MSKWRAFFHLFSKESGAFQAIKLQINLQYLKNHGDLKSDY